MTFQPRIIIIEGQKKGRDFLKKRIIFLLILLLIPTVKAKEEVIRKYKYYEIIKEEGPYSLETTEEYPLINYDDYIYTDYVETETKPENLDGREIEKMTYYKYKRTKNINYLKIQNKSAPFSISNIRIEYDGKPIDYTYESENGNMTDIQKRAYITFYFEQEIDQNKLKLIIEADTPGTTLLIKTGDQVCEQTQQTVVFTNLLEWFGTDATYYAYSDWVEDIYPYQLNTANSRTVISEGEVVKYRYRDKLYKIYREDKNYSNDYLLTPVEPYTIKDENDFIEEIIKTEDEIEEITETDKPKEESKIKPKEIYINDAPLIYEIVEVPNTGINMQIKKIK